MYLCFFSINTEFSFNLWYENYHYFLMPIKTHEIFIFIPLDENKPHIFRKKLEYPLFIYLAGI